MFDLTLCSGLLLEVNANKKYSPSDFIAVSGMILLYDIHFRYKEGCVAS
jgi:hypothetical protein